MEYTALLLLPLAGVLSGGWQPVKHIDKIGSPLTGLCIGYLLGLPWYFVIGAAVIGWAVEKLSPAKYSHGLILDNYGGTPSHERESAFFEIRKRKFLEFNLAVRGLFSALLWSIYLHFTGHINYAVFAYVLSWPAGAHAGRLSKLGDPWHQRLSEAVRQLLTGLLIYAI